MKSITPKALIIASIVLSSFSQTALFAGLQWILRSSIYVRLIGLGNSDTYSVKLVMTQIREII
jgi:hypothetical protein